jgi:hypothetical protein
LARALTFGLVTVFTLGACAGSEAEVIRKRESDSGGSGGVGGHAGRDSGHGDEIVTDSSDPDLGDAPLVPVKVGIVPLPLASDPDSGTTVAERAAAHLEVISAGARGVSIVRSWSQLFTTATQPESGEWNELRGAASLYRDAERSLLLCLRVVDRTLDARPSGVAGAWDGPATLAAVDRLIDQALLGAGPELQYLVIGNEVDRWLAGKSTTEKAAFATFIQHTVNRAKAHASKPPELKVGVSLTSDALVGASAATFLDLVRATDVLVVTYHPLDESFMARPPSVAAADLDAMAAAVATDAEPARQIVLQEVGFPSSELVDGSLDEQRTFFDGLFQALLFRRERFPFVSVHALHDLPASQCAADAVALGAAGNAKAEAARCSLGLRDSTGSSKPAFSSVLGAMATFRAP